MLQEDTFTFDSPAGGAVAIAPTRRARIVVADDHLLTRAGLRAVLADDPEFELVGEASNGGEAVALSRSLQPDLVLMDVNLPGISGLEATRRIRTAHPGTVVLLLSSRDALDIEQDAADCGAAAYVPKSMFGSRRLIEAWAAAT